MDGFLEFKDIRRGSLIWKSEGTGVSDLEFPEGTDKSVFLENTYFINLTSSQVKHELTTLLTTVEACMQDTRQQEKTGIHRSICFHVHLKKKTNEMWVIH